MMTSEFRNDNKSNIFLIKPHRSRVDFSQPKHHHCDFCHTEALAEVSVFLDSFRLSLRYARNDNKSDILVFLFLKITKLHIKFFN